MQFVRHMARHACHHCFHLRCLQICTRMLVGKGFSPPMPWRRLGSSTWRQELCLAWCRRDCPLSPVDPPVAPLLLPWPLAVRQRDNNVCPLFSLNRVLFECMKSSFSSANQGILPLSCPAPILERVGDKIVLVLWTSNKAQCLQWLALPWIADTHSKAISGSLYTSSNCHIPFCHGTIS